MSDSYEIGGVKVTPTGGGWYELSGQGINGEPEKVQGKEHADKRAAELGQATAQGGDGHIPAQDADALSQSLIGSVGGDVVQPGDHRNAAERTQERAAGLPEPIKPASIDAAAPPAPAAPSKVDQDKDAEIARLKEELAQSKADHTSLDERIAKIEKAASGLVTTVTASEAPAPAVPLTIPQQYTGEMDKDAKAALEKAGLTVSKIVLEENESIPPTGLFVGHNGKSYMIKPGEEVDVPDFLLGVLDDAVMSAPIVDPASQKVLGYRNRSKYPYRRVK